MKPVISAVSNDLVTDRRIFRIASSLNKAGYPVFLIGRKLPGSLPLDHFPFPAKRFVMYFRKGFLFYAFFNIRLFFYLLVHPASILVANDLDTLPAVFLAAKIKKKPLVYDTHEYFTGVPELENRPRVQKFWESIEKRIFPHLGKVTTVNDSIAGLYREKYGIPITVIRNLAEKTSTTAISRNLLDLLPDQKMVIIQGTGINRDRGAEEAVLAMEYLDNIVLFILGEGNAIPFLKNLVQNKKLEQKVRFIDKMPYGEMMRYTAAADLGLSLDKSDYINFRFSLPNKITDYIQAGIPVLASNLPEISLIIRNYDIGELIDTHDPRAIAEKIEQMVNNEKMQKQWRQNARKAAGILCWENEEKKLLSFYLDILPPDS